MYAARSNRTNDLEEYNAPIQKLIYLKSLRDMYAKLHKANLTINQVEYNII